jgi:uncharacterized protein YecT (DUF1311 family)
MRDMVAAFEWGKSVSVKLGLIFAAALATVLLTGMACTADAAPSFDCATATTLREKAVCRDQRLAALDQDIAAAYARVLARLDSADASRLRQDQRRFIIVIDTGFERAFALGDEEAENRLNEEIKNRSDDDTIAGLEDELRKRLRFLKSLDLGRQTLTGKWQSASVELSVTRKKTAFSVAFDTTTYGFGRYDCGFTARFVVDHGGLKAGVARHLQTEEEVHNELTLQRHGATLELREIGTPAWDRWICPRVPELHEVLFPVRMAE